MSTNCPLAAVELGRDGDVRYAELARGIGGTAVALHHLPRPEPINNEFEETTERKNIV
jgi:hypothetical protein